MTPLDRDEALAARAGGEDAPDATPAEVDELLDQNPSARNELADLEGTVRLLHQAALPESGERRDRVTARIVAGRRFRFRITAAAALLLVAGGALLFVTRNGARPASDDRIFAEVVTRWESTTEPATLIDELVKVGTTNARGGAPGFGAPLGGEAAGQAADDVLRPFVAQASFTVLTATRLPPGSSLVQARFRRAQPDVRPFDFLWLEYAAPGGPIIVLQAVDEPEVRRAFEHLSPPSFWQTATREREGTRAIVLSPILTPRSIAEAADGLEVHSR